MAASDMMSALMELCQEKHIDQLYLIDRLEQSLAKSYAEILHLEWGAKVTIEEVNYDECVRMAAAEADACERGVIVQDTAWEGYEKIPSWIMEGYGTMASEAAEQLREMLKNGIIEKEEYNILMRKYGLK